MSRPWSRPGCLSGRTGRAGTGPAADGARPVTISSDDQLAGDQAQRRPAVGERDVQARHSGDAAEYRLVVDRHRPRPGRARPRRPAPGWPSRTADASASSSGTRSSGTVARRLVELGVQPPGAHHEACPSGVGRSDTRGALTTARTPTSTGRVRTRAAGECCARIGTPSSPSMAGHCGAGGHDDGVRVDRCPVRDPDAVPPGRRRRRRAAPTPVSSRRRPWSTWPARCRTRDGRSTQPSPGLRYAPLGRHRDAGHRRAPGAPRTPPHRCAWRSRRPRSPQNTHIEPQPRHVHQSRGQASGSGRYPIIRSR